MQCGDDLPAEVFEVGFFLGVAGGVAGELGLPEFGVVLWERVIAPRTAVPEAAVDKDREATADETDVGTDRSVMSNE